MQLQSTLCTAVSIRARVRHKVEAWNLVHALSEGLHYGETFKVSIDSIDSAHVKLSQPFKDFQQQLEMFHDQPTEEKDNCAPPKATNQVAGHEVDHLKKYIFAPVFQSPECEMPDRVAARKVWFAKSKARLSF